MSNDPSSTEPSDKPTGDGGTPRPGSGWLATLRARLGLSGPQTLRDSLEEALRTEARAEQAFSAAERDMLLRILRFGAMRVDDVMVPRADIIAIDENASLADLLRLFKQAGVSRIPLFHETLDDPRGMVHIKDLVRYLMGDPALQETQAALVDSLKSVDLAKVDLSRPVTGARLRRPMLYVPPSMPAMNLLIRMQSTRIHMALVVDEYGGTDGLVTIEDLVEQVVGDIEDEHDVDEAANLVEDATGSIIAQARTPVSELEARLDIKLLTPEEQSEIDTLGGLVFSVIGRVPARGEIVRHASGLEFEVIDADPRRIKKLKVHRPRAEGEERAPSMPPATAPVGDRTAAPAGDATVAKPNKLRPATSTSAAE